MTEEDKIYGEYLRYQEERRLKGEISISFDEYCNKFYGEKGEKEKSNDVR